MVTAEQGIALEMKALILDGGRGARPKPLTNALSKCLLHQLEYLCHREYVFNIFLIRYSEFVSHLQVFPL